MFARRWPKGATFLIRYDNLTYQVSISPIRYDNLIYGQERAVKWGPLERGDILDRARLDQVILRF